MRSKVVWPGSVMGQPTSRGIPQQRSSTRVDPVARSISSLSALQDLPDNSPAAKAVTPQPRQSGYSMRGFHRLLVGADITVVVCSVLAAQVLSGGLTAGGSWLGAVGLICGWLVALVLEGVWDASTDAGGVAYRRILTAGAVVFLLTGIVAFLTESAAGRSYLLVALPAGTAGVLLAHWGCHRRLIWLRRRRSQLEPVLIVGERINAGVLCASVGEHPEAGYRVAGVVLLRDRLHGLRRADEVDGCPVVGAIDLGGADLAGSAVVGSAVGGSAVGGPVPGPPVRDGAIADVLVSAAREVVAAATACGARFVALADGPTELVDELLMVLAGSGIQVLAAPGVIHPDGLPAQLEAGLPLRVPDLTVDGSRAWGKAAFDLIVAALGLLLLSPVLLLAALAVLLADGGPIIHRTNYVGLAGLVFPAWSFRCTPHGVRARPVLRTASDERSGYVLAVTPVGKVLRRTGFEEAPRLFNVLFRQMSLVGPQPVPAGEIVTCPPLNRPGLTGRWRIFPCVRGRSASGTEYGVSVEDRSNAGPAENVAVNDASDGFARDARRVDAGGVSWSAGDDLAILARTVRLALAGRLAA